MRPIWLILIATASTVALAGRVEVRAGRITYLSADNIYISYFFTDGLVPALMDKEGRGLAANVKVVRLALCPPTLCL